MARTASKKKSSSKKAAAAEPEPVLGSATEPQAGAGIDEILDGLEQVVSELEAGDLPLEEALRRFEQGVVLARQGSTVLDGVEQRVEQLLADRDEAVPFADDE